MPPDSATNYHSLYHRFRSPRHGQWMHSACHGKIWLSTGNHLGQRGGEVAGLPLQQDYSDCPRVAQHAWFWDLVAMSSQIPLCLPNLPNLVSQPFNQTLHRNLSNLNLHAWLLEPQQSRSRGSLRQWQHELRLLREDQPDLSMRQSGTIFTKWCLSNQVDFRAPPLKAIADFLLHLLYPQTKVGDILDSGLSRRRRRRRRNFLVDAITQKQINIFFSNLVHMLRVPKGRSLF